MKKLTLQDIRDLGPCYDPSDFAPEGWEGTILDILKDKRVPAKDRIWVATRKNVVPIIVIQKWALWCAKQALKIRPSETGTHCIEVAEGFLKGKATLQELEEARRECYSAAAAYAAAAYSAAASAAYSAAYSAAASAAAYSAAYAAKDKARKDQVSQLIKMINAYNKKVVDK